MDDRIKIEKHPTNKFELCASLGLGRSENSVHAAGLCGIPPVRGEPSKHYLINIITTIIIIIIIITTTTTIVTRINVVVITTSITIAIIIVTISIIVIIEDYM